MGEAKNIYFTRLKYEVQITQSMRVKVRHVSTKSPNHFQIKDAIYFSRRHIHATVDPLSATSLIASSRSMDNRRHPQLLSTYLSLSEPLCSSSSLFRALIQRHASGNERSLFHPQLHQGE